MGCGKHSDELRELGKRGPYQRFVEFPLDFEVDDETLKTGVAIQPCATCGEVFCSCLKDNSVNWPNIMQDLCWGPVIPSNPDTPHECTCDMMLLMQQGCQCGGI